MSEVIKQVGWVRQAIENKLLPFGFSKEEISDVQYGLTEASLRGIDTHGIRLFANYLKEIKGGRSAPNPKFSWSQSKPAVARLDAGNALGIIAGMAGIRKAMELAKNQGIGAVLVSNSNHYGAASIYSIAAARKGFIGLCFSNGDALIAPYGGKQPMLGTNPISMAAPAGNEEPFCLDMACSQVAFSKVKQYLNNNQEIPKDWIHENEGVDPVLKPLGGYKGMGLAIMVQILTSVLANSIFDHEMKHFYAPPYDKGNNVCHLMIAIEIESFISLDSFSSLLNSLREHIRNSELDDESPEILIPGDKETKTYRKRIKQGIPMSLDEYESLSL